MATKNRGSRRGGLPLALEILTSDHRKVERLFEQFESMKEKEDASRIAIAQQVCSEITIHAQIEEDLLYPWLRENLEDAEMVAEALVEHASARDLIAQIMPVGEPDEEYDAKVKVLSEYVKHHVKEEENEIFPEVADQEEELDELGQEMAARKAELREEMGLGDESDQAADAQLMPPGAAGRGQKPRAYSPRQAR